MEKNICNEFVMIENVYWKKCVSEPEVLALVDVSGITSKSWLHFSDWKTSSIFIYSLWFKLNIYLFI